MENKIGIRSRAEAKLTGSKAPPKTLSPEETQELIHELQVHQLELEMQNEDLRSSRSELEALLSRYADLYDFAPIGYCTLDQNGLVLEINLKGAELLGIEKKHLIQKPFLIYVAEEDRARFRSYLSTALKNAGRETYELKLKPREGLPFDAKIEQTIGKDIDERSVRRIAIIDITRQKQAEREQKKLLSREQKAKLEAEEAGRLKDEFLATVSHELRTPLNAIYGWAHLLRTGEADPETRNAALEAIDRNVKAQESLINDLLDLSSMITGKLCLKIRPLNLAEIIEAAVETVREAAEAKGIKMKLNVDPSIEPVTVDPDRMQQVLWNLLSNAIKFTPQEGGGIEIFLERADRSIQIRVKDSGIGISSDFLPYIFDRFRQAEASATRSHGGLGLGLAMVRHLTELHGGSVSAESAGEGKGATVMVRLPIRAVKK